MENGKIITVVVIFLFAAGTLAISVLQFLEKGFLFNNAYLYASKEERSKINKKPHYRQSATVFLILCLVFITMGLNLITEKVLFLTIGICLIIVVLIYAVVSSILIEKAKKKGKPWED